MQHKQGLVAELGPAHISHRVLKHEPITFTATSHITSVVAASETSNDLR